MRTYLFGNLNYNAPVTTDKLGAYAELTANLSQNIVVRGGARVDQFAYLIDNAPVFSPRAAASYMFTPFTSLNFSWGIYEQSPEDIWLAAQPQNRNLSYIKCNHYILGFEHQFDADVKFTCELYDKEYSGYPVSETNPYFNFINAGAEYGTFVAPPAQSIGTGYVRGVDVFMQKKLTEGLYGTADYSYMKTAFTAAAGGARPESFDNQNNFTLTAGYVFPGGAELSAKFRCMNGVPYTPFDDSLSKVLNNGVVNYSAADTCACRPTAVWMFGLITAGISGGEIW